MPLAIATGGSFIMSLSAGFKTPLCRELCRTRKIKRVDEACRLRAGLSGWFKWVLRTYTLSPHLVSTLCRIRFVSTLCPYALSKAKEQANVPAPRSLPMRLGARGLRGSLMRRMNSERHRRGRRAPAFRLPVHIRCACTEPPRPPPRHKLTV